MKSTELRKIQEPLKQQYRTDPKSALVTLKAQSRIGDGITCKVETGQALATAGLHPASGGNGLVACSGDMLLEALVACAGVTLNAVATAIEFELKDATVHAEGDLDFRGTLAVDKETNVGFKNIRLRFEIDSSETRDRIETLLKLTERYCVVYQTIAQGTDLKIITH